jgi:hypothetical protein
MKTKNTWLVGTGVILTAVPMLIYLLGLCALLLLQAALRWLNPSLERGFVLSWIVLGSIVSSKSMAELRDRIMTESL